jgi:hypothetical protein
MWLTKLAKPIVPLVGVFPYDQWLYSIDLISRNSIFAHLGFLFKSIGQIGPLNISPDTTKSPINWLFN